MKKVLILTSYYDPIPSANGIIARKLSNILVESGCEVFCICLSRENRYCEEIINDVKTYQIPDSIYSRLMKYCNSKERSLLLSALKNLGAIFRKSKIALTMSFTLNYDWLQSYRVAKVADRIIEVEGVDTVISLYKPYSNLSALTKIKHSKLSIKTIAYYLDLYSSMKVPFDFLHPYVNKLFKKDLIKMINLHDLIMFPISVKNIYSEIIPKSEKDKVQFVEYPTFDKELYHAESTKNGKHIRMSYAGTLDYRYRNPKELLEYFSKVRIDNYEVSFNLYGKSNCMELIHDISSSSDVIIKHLGLVNYDSVLHELSNSDILINISNQLPDAVPSKIFELFSFGKPIINFVFDRDDKTLEYFKKYPLCLNLYRDGDYETQLKMLEEFIVNSRKSSIDYNSICEIYSKNLPEYIVSIISSKLEKG